MSLTFLDVAKTVGVDDRYTPEPVPLSARAASRVEQIVDAANAKGSGPLVVVHLGSGHNFIGRRWPLDNFAELLGRLAPRHDFRILLTGVESERHLCEAVLARCGPQVTDLVGRIDLIELAGLIAAADAVFCNDTLPVHLAGAGGTPVYAFYGPNTPRLYGPLLSTGRAFYRQLACSPCLTNLNSKESACQLPVCMESIGVDEVERCYEADLAAAQPAPKHSDRSVR